MFTRQLILELSKRMTFGLNGVSNMSMVWEDNIGAQKLANGKGPIMLSRTKHVGIKYHWFRENMHPSSIEIRCISTKE